MTWVVDRGLDKLLAQINAAAPLRSKASDGSVGDLAHAAGTSDHNPQASAGDDPPNQVDARDFTHDPAAGADMAVISEAIRQSKDQRVSYVIFNRRIFSGTDSAQPWVWRPYSGDNPHDHHMHVSVNDVHNDETQDWAIGGTTMADPNYDTWPIPVEAGRRPLAVMLADVWTEEQAGHGAYGPDKSHRQKQLDRIEALLVEREAIDYDKLATLIASKLPASTLTAADVRTALADVLLHGVTPE